MMRETYIDDNGIEWWKNEGGLLSYAEMREHRALCFMLKKRIG